MKMQKFKTVYLAALLIQASANAQTPTPQVSAIFAPGTGQIEITQELSSQIATYAMNSRDTLRVALNDIAGQPTTDALSILHRAACEVVVRSHQVVGGSELLLRIILSQALELTHGLPADEMCVVLATQPILASRFYLPPAGAAAETALQPLYYQILLNSVNLAKEFAEIDSAVINRIQNGQAAVGILDLPYANAALRRLQMSEAWNQSASFLGTRMEYTHLRAVFQQWLNLVMNPNDRARMLSAAHVLRTRQVMAETQVADAATAPLEEIQRKTRRLRRHLSELVTPRT